ncbi:restriction endonuclease subunit S [Enterococcus faecalis]|uniref:restriction endonuclease subunit S n=1 Tax=Enterococcus faecalis TaxID=1351 RepID=UPI00254C0B79|nr:restriction endonuclease subunit S [Enterococcus faecalis]
MKKVPRLRFRGFQEDWEQRKLIDLVVRLNKSTNSSRLPKLEFEDIVAGEGRLNKDVSQKFDNRKWIEFLPNDILYGKLRPYLKNWLKATFTGVALGDFWVFRVKNSDSDFIYSLIQADRYQKAANDTSGTKMPRSDWKKVSGTVFYVPNDLKEQQKIGTLFKQIADAITLHQRKLDQLKNLKNAFLQLMFVSNSPENSTVPKLRFANFTEEWELCGFFDTIENTIDFRGRTPKKLGLDWSDNGYLALSALNVKHGYIDSNIDAHYGNQELYDKWMSGKELRKGQVLFTTEAPMGNVAQIPDNTGYILSQRTIAFETKKNRITDDFLAVLLGSPKIFNELSSLSSGGTAKGISQKSLSQLRVQIPCSISEQKEIGIFFKQLNETITLHQNKLDQLKELKKSYLQNMFI